MLLVFVTVVFNFDKSSVILETDNLDVLIRDEILDDDMLVFREKSLVLGSAVSVKLLFFSDKILVPRLGNLPNIDVSKELIIVGQEEIFSKSDLWLSLVFTSLK